MFKRSAAVLLVLFLAGCASQIMEGYVGKSVQEPILDYGPPANIVELNNGQRGYQWRIDSSGVIATPTYSSATVYGSGGFATATGTSTAFVPYSQSCLYTLIAAPKGNDWIVVGYRQPTLGCE